MKKHTHKLTGILVAAALILPVFASAQTTDVSSQIQALMSQIAALQLQVHNLMGSIGSTTPHAWSSDGSGNSGSGSYGNPGGNNGGTPGGNTANSSNSSWSSNGSNGGSSNNWGGGDNGSSTRPSPGDPIGPVRSGTTTPPLLKDKVPCMKITRDLGIGSKGDDVTQIQGILAQNGFLSSTSTTGFFGSLTAKAVKDFAHHFGITGSTTGTLGFNIRDFFKSRCGGDGGKDGPDHSMGSTTRPLPPCGDCTGGWGPAGSTTHPCPAMHTNNGSDAAAVALALFEPHTILPPDMHPCNTAVWHSSPGPASSTAGSW